MLTRRFGQRWGRRLPFLFASTVAVTAYLLCPFLQTGLSVAVASAFVAFATDSVMPAVWAIAQDIGKTHVASTLAWSNMWGNFGASAVARLIPLLLVSRVHGPEWHEVFWMCAAGFVLLGSCSLMVDCTRPLLQVDRAQPRLAATNASI